MTIRISFALFIILCHIDCIAARHHSAAFNIALTKGADARVHLNVYNESGEPIPNAKIQATLANQVSDYSINGTTDSKGVFVISGNTTGDYLQFLVTKEGYYDSWDSISYITMGKEHEVSGGKWQPYDANHQIILRRIQNPLAIKIGNGKFVLTRYLNQWLGFDIQKYDFVQPYGMGVVTDFEVKIDWDGKWLPEYTGMGINVRFSIPYSGYYEHPVSSVSKFKGPYVADTRKAFEKTAMFEEKVDASFNRIQHHFDEHKCWIVRSRCKVDKDGKLISANYSIIHTIDFCGKKDSRGGVRVKGFFNPTPNDVNLEPKR